VGGEGARDRAFLKVRVALALFFERALIEITRGGRSTGPVAMRWPRRRRSPTSIGRRVMATATTPEPMTRVPALTPPGLEKLATFPFAVLTRVDDAAIPSASRSTARSTATPARDVRAAGRAHRPDGRDVSLTGSHIRPQPGYGYDERRHVTVWGRAATPGPATVTLRAAGLGLGRGRGPVLRVLGAVDGAVAALLRRPVRRARDAGQAPPVAGWLALRTTRLPFLTATIVPVVLGIAIAASQGSFDWFTAC
jgi:hypothetical protein